MAKVFVHKVSVIGGKLHGRSAFDALNQASNARLGKRFDEPLEDRSLVSECMFFEDMPSTGRVIVNFNGPGAVWRPGSPRVSAVVAIME